MEKITKLTIESGARKDRPGTRISRPSLSHEKLLGTLFATARIKDATIDESGIIDSIIRILENNYYGFNIPDSSPVDLDFEHIFESALQKTNLEIYQKYEEVQWDSLLGRLSVAAGVVNDSNICFAHFGDCQAFLSRKGRMIEIIPREKGAEESKGGPSIGSARIFSYITSGDIEEGDFLIFSAEDVSSRLTMEKMRDVLNSCSSSDEVREKMTKLAESTPKASASLILIEGTAEKKKASEEDELIESVFGSPRPDAAPKKGPSPGKALKKFSSVLSSVKKKRDAKDNKKKKNSDPGPEKKKMKPAIEGRVAEKKPAKVQEKLAFGKKDNGGRDNEREKKQNADKSAKAKDGALKKAGKILEKTLKKISGIASSLPEKPAEKAGKAVLGLRKKFEKLPRSSKIFLMISLILAVLFVQSTFLSAGRKKKQQDMEAYNQSVDSIEKLQNEGLAALIYNDEAKAKELLGEAEKMIEQLTRETKEQKEKIRLLTQENTVHLNRLYKIISIDEPAMLADFGQDASVNGLIMAGGSVYAFDSGNVYGIEEGGKKISQSTMTGLKYAAPYGQASAMFYRDGKVLASFDCQTGKFSPLNLFSKYDLDRTSDMAVYGQKVYVLSPGDNQIFKYYQGTSGFGQESSWITDGTSVEDAVSLAIDSSVYVLKSDGSIIRLYAGKKAEFPTDKIGPPMEGPKEIYTDYGINFLYILDTAYKRLIIMDKGGKLIQQYRSEKFEDLKDMAIDERNGKAYLLAGNKVYEIAIR